LQVESNRVEEHEGTLRFLQNPSHDNYALVVDEYLPMLRKFIYRIVLNEHDADDIAQETFISAFQNIRNFKCNAKFKTWICKIAHNKACSFLKTKNRYSTNATELKFEPVSSKHQHPDNRMKTVEAHEQIHAAITELPESLRSTIILITIDETPIDEAVYILKCNKATIYWRLHKARKILKKKLAIGK